MRELACFLLLAVVSLTLFSQCHSIRQTLGQLGVDYEGEYFAWYNWRLKPKQEVRLYVRNFHGFHKFAFLAFDPSQKVAEIVVIDALANPEYSRTCRRFVGNPYNSKPLFVSFDFRADGILVFEYSAETLTISGASWRAIIDTKKCPVTQSSQAEEQEAEEETAVAPSDLSADETASTENVTNHLVRLNHPSIARMEPVEVNSTEGYIFPSEHNESDTKTNINFMNSATGETQVIDVIELQTAGWARRDSWDHRKYGVCFMKDLNILCYQTQAGRRVLNNINLVLPQKVDWFGVYNLKEPGVLVVTGDCPSNFCTEFVARKLSEPGKVSDAVTKLHPNMECPNPSSNLNVDGALYESPTSNEICFNFECSKKDSSGRVIFQYRRQCFKESDFS